jgi:trans-aconitate 2-methyltransferase
VALGAHLEHVAPEDQRDFVRAVAERLPRPEIDYVRLNILARRLDPTETRGFGGDPNGR